MDPFSLSTGGGGVSGGSSEATSKTSYADKFGDVYNIKGSGGMGKTNWLLLGGMAIAVVVAWKLLSKK